MATTIPNMYDCEEAAEYLGIEPVTLRRYALDKRIHGYKAGANWVFTQDELDRFKAIPRKVGNPNFGRKKRGRK